MAMTTRPRPDANAAPPVAGETSRAAWLVLAADGPAAMLAGAVRSVTVSVVADPARFRDLLVSQRPRLVVCSRPPASLGDLAAVANLRRRRPSLRAVLVTPPDAVDARLEALARGFDDALASSVPPNELAGRLALLDSRARDRRPAGSLRRFGDEFELDLAAHELRRRGEVLHLRPKEFGLLALLTSHPGRAYTRAEILDRVWGRPGGAGRTVDVHVRWLRSKIETHPERPEMLVTVRGIGYRLDRTPR